MLLTIILVNKLLCVSELVVEASPEKTLGKFKCMFFFLFFFYMLFFFPLRSFYPYGHGSNVHLICVPFLLFKELSATERYQSEESYYKQLEKESRLCWGKKYEKLYHNIFNELKMVI